MKKISWFVFLVLVLFACRSEKQNTTQSQLNEYFGAYPVTFDPAISSDSNGSTILRNILEPLLRIDNTENGTPIVVAAGAKRWTQSSDNLVYTFYLNDNFWNDGKPVTSGDYAYALKRNVLPETKCSYINVLYSIKNVRSILAGKAQVNELGIETPDDKTLIIKLETPVQYFYELLRMNAFLPQREDMLKKHGKNYGTSAETTPTCGPYLLEHANKEATKDNPALTLTKHKKFWNAPNVHVESVKVYISTETIEAFEKNKTFTATIGTPEERKRLLKNSAYSYYMTENPRTGFILASGHETALTRNIKIRRAISACLDRYEFADLMASDTPIPANSFCPSSVHISGLVFNDGKNAPIDKLTSEVQNPRALFIEGLKELGLKPDPSKVTFKLHRGATNTQAKQLLAFLKMNIETVIGCKIETIATNWSTFEKTLKDGTYELAYFNWSGGFDDPSSFFEVFWSKNKTYNTGWVCKPYDDLIEQAQQESDVNKRKALFHNIDNILVNEEALVMPMAFTVRHTFVNNVLQGYSTYFFNSVGYQRYKIVQQPNM